MSELEDILEELISCCSEDCVVGVSLYATQHTIPALQAYTDRAVTKRDKDIAGWLEYKPDVFNKSCNQCGGEMVICRGQHPGSEKRLLCPTCLDDIRLDVISNLTSQAAQALTISVRDGGGSSAAGEKT